MSFAIDTFDPERFGLVTGSVCSPLVPKVSAKVGMITLAQELAKEKYFQFYDEVSTWQMTHGHLAEPLAFEHYQKYFDKDLKEGCWIKKGETGGTIDSWGVDFKAPTTLSNWLKYLYEPISAQQYNQGQMYMNLTGLKEWKFCAYLVETNLMSENGLVYPIEESKRAIIQTIKYDSDWNSKFNANLPVVIEMRDKYIEQLEEKFGKKEVKNGK